MDRSAHGLLPSRAARLVVVVALLVAGLVLPPPPGAAGAPARVGPTDSTLAAAWYRDFLGRSADAGTGYWVQRLSSASREQVLAELLRTPEESRTQVGGYYARYLGRTPDAGAGYWTSGVEAGRFPLEWVEQNVLASDEYVAGHGGAGASSLVVSWYAAILGRSDATEGDVRYWQQRLRNGGALEAVRGIWYSSEAVSRRVSAHYRQLLGRSASRSEVQLWAPQEVASDIATQTGIASSAEYDRVGAARSVLDRLNPAERAAQVIMVGVPAGAPASQRYLVGQDVVGGVFLVGRSSRGVSATAADVAVLQSDIAARGLPDVLVAADEEGGRVQTLSGSGFPSIPSALAQGRLSQSGLASLTQSWAGPLRRSGVSLNLAPVASPVPAGTEAQNPPIGALDRQYGSDPAAVAADVSTVVTASRDVGLLSTAKHFPGLGRVRANTDFTADVVDDVTTAGSASLEPFRAAARAGAAAVMVSSARYTRIDASSVAAFSPRIVSGLLRDEVGFTGLVMTDDMGNAAAVQSVPVGQRAVRFLRAGGQLVLTVDPADLGPMEDALTQAAASDPGFAATMDAAAVRVLQTRMPTR